MIFKKFTQQPLLKATMVSDKAHIQVQTFKSSLFIASLLKIEIKQAIYI